ncbi:hypothetical protein MTR67_036464 [Solanum verrucosum]|uniref:Uncharacterized protein n=1 Tax=Solanum verrucosum TaxID=315347 RepID=A0AAF0UCK3_SOLVR|nr:hypothetical protein MTR67_036464 [Solanum verrucosum]
MTTLPPGFRPISGNPKPPFIFFFFRQNATKYPAVLLLSHIGAQPMKQKSEDQYLVKRLEVQMDFDILEIDAANLKWFEFYGTSKSICFKNAPMLRNVNMYLDPQVLTDPSPVCSNVTKFFHYMPSLQELELCGSTLEYLIMGGIPESPPTALNNVKFHCILDMCLRNVKEFSSVVYLITSCPKLQELRIECGFTGFEMDMEFMKIILASAPVLEEIVWNMTHYIHRGTKMMDEMKQFSRVSPDVRFIFEEAYADPEFP